jgi:hypothetical protein
MPRQLFQAISTKDGISIFNRMLKQACDKYYKDEGGLLNLLEITYKGIPKDYDIEQLILRTCKVDKIANVSTYNLADTPFQPRGLRGGDPEMTLLERADGNMLQITFRINQVSRKCLGRNFVVRLEKKHGDKYDIVGEKSSEFSVLSKRKVLASERENFLGDTVLGKRKKKESRPKKKKNVIEPIPLTSSSETFSYDNEIINMFGDDSSNDSVTLLKNFIEQIEDNNFKRIKRDLQHFKTKLEEELTRSQEIFQEEQRNLLCEQVELYVFKNLKF